MSDDRETNRLAEAVRRSVEDALAEDRVVEDVTTLAAVPADANARGVVLFRKEGILAGTEPFTAVFRSVDRDVPIRWKHSEGDRIGAGEEVCEIAGRASSLLRAERAALNFLMHLSGIATKTARFVDAVAGRDVEILDTRKTTPGLRHLEKAAVRAGGGVNHRPDLASMALIKENHIAAAGGITAAVAAVRERTPGIPIEVEIETPDQLDEVLPLGVERLMLDNFDDDSIRAAVDRIRRVDRPPYIEISGGVDLDRVERLAGLGVDGISIGALTHSAPAADVSLLLRRD